MATNVTEQNMSEPIIRAKMVTAENFATQKTMADCGEYGTLVFDEPIAHGGTGEGPSPLQGVLSALCACESVTFNRTAAEMGFEYKKLSFSAEYKIDIRGRLGMRGVTQHFKIVRVEIQVETQEAVERLEEVVKETELRCPVYNLIQNAGVDITCQWVRV
jgi:uncharacterized OsmC-like protein